MSSTLDETERSGSSTSSSRTAARGTTVTDRRMAQRTVEHPIFEEAMIYTSDEFWRKKMMLAARGKFPSGFSYKGGFLYHKRKKGKTTSVAISPIPQQALHDFIDFMHTTGVYSDIDQAHDKLNAEIMSSGDETQIAQRWSQVPKKMRPILVDEYVSLITASYKLTREQAYSLNKCAHLGVKVKIFDKSNITLSNGKILTIHGIIYDAPTGLFIIDQQLWDKRRAALNINVPYQLETGISPLLDMHVADVPDYDLATNKLLKRYNELATYKVKQPKKADVFITPAVPVPPIGAVTGILGGTPLGIPVPMVTLMIVDD